MVKFLTIAVLMLGSIGCATVGYSPQETCARDGMIFTGRHYEAGSVGNLATSSNGMTCGRPATAEEKCEIEASAASLDRKENACHQYDTYEHQSCSVANSNWAFSDRDVSEIERLAQVAYRKAYAECVKKLAD